MLHQLHLWLRATVIITDSSALSLLSNLLHLPKKTFKEWNTGLLVEPFVPFFLKRHYHVCTLVENQNILDLKTGHVFKHYLLPLHPFLLCQGLHCSRPPDALNIPLKMAALPSSLCQANPPTIFKSHDSKSRKRTKTSLPSGALV